MRWIVFISLFSVLASAVPNCWEEVARPGVYSIEIKKPDAHSLLNILKSVQNADLNVISYEVLADRLMVDTKATDRNAAERRLKFFEEGYGENGYFKGELTIRCAMKGSIGRKLGYKAVEEIRGDSGPIINIAKKAVVVPECASNRYRLWKPYNAFQEGQFAVLYMMEEVQRSSYLTPLNFPVEDTLFAGFFRMEVEVAGLGTEKQAEYLAAARKILERLAKKPIYITCVEKDVPEKRQE